MLAPPGPLVRTDRCRCQEGRTQRREHEVEQGLQLVRGQMPVELLDVRVAESFCYLLLHPFQQVAIQHCHLARLCSWRFECVVRAFVRALTLFPFSGIIDNPLDDVNQASLLCSV